MNTILKKLTNTRTVLAIAGAVLLILNTLGAKIDNEAIMVVINSTLGILVLLGIMNDKGMESTAWDK